MTFEKFIKLINILDNDGEILVMEDIGYEKEVCTISKYDDIFECMKYFKDSRYSLYIYEDDKPYYEIKYLVIDENEYRIGYSSYELKNVFVWLEE